jgi:hypothetical protein
MANMNCFQLVKTVLDEIYEKIPLVEETEKDDAIKKELDSLGSKYAKLSSGEAVDYANPVTRFAYIYRYVTSHANIVYDIIKSCPELTNLMASDKVTMTCIGGGPGSDLLGVLKYLITNQKAPFLKCFLYDKEENWGESWSDVDDKLESQLKISTFFQRFDVGDNSTWSHHSKYLNSDIFTMIYFMSEVFKIKKQAEPFFQNFFAKAKTGSLFLYVDNNSKNFYGWFDELAKRNSLVTIKSNSEKIQISTDEEKRDLGSYCKKFTPPQSWVLILLTEYAGKIKHDNFSKLQDGYTSFLWRMVH